jgi:lipopolysaccharide export LptBFGC system permease protein LptF
MRAWIAKHPLIFCFTVFAVLMLSLRFVAKGMIDNYGAWIAVPIIAVLFVIGLWIDRRDRQRDRAG